MPNKRWNDMNKDQKTDSSEGARGKGVAKAAKTTYVNQAAFKTGMYDSDSSLGGVEGPSSKPHAVGKWKGNEHGGRFGSHKNK